MQEACGIESSIINVTVSKREAFTTLVVGGPYQIAENAVYRQAETSSDNVPNPDDSRTFTAQVSTWNGPFDDADLCLCFPPGQGTVTLTGVALTPPGQ